MYAIMLDHFGGQSRSPVAEFLEPISFVRIKAKDAKHMHIAVYSDAGEMLAAGYSDKYHADTTRSTMSKDDPQFWVKPEVAPTETMSGRISWP